MPTLYLVRHGRAAAGWDTAADPPLDVLGREQSVATATLLAARVQGAGSERHAIDVSTSPLLRCRETAAAFERVTGMAARIEPLIAEIPSPAGIAMAERVTWLRRTMHGTWGELVAREGTVYADFRAGLVGWAKRVTRDTVAFSHFVAINALIGAATHDDRVVIRSLDNASVTVLHVGADGELSFVEGGSEADTLIR